MNSSDTITISTSLPVAVIPSETEIVYNPETNAYALCLGVKVQLPITELVEVLLKFNQEQILHSSNSTSVDEQHFAVNLQNPLHELIPDDLLLLQDLPDETTVAQVINQDDFLPPLSMPEMHAGNTADNSPVYTPRGGSGGPDLCCGKYPNDNFARISLEVVKSEPSLHEYRERAKWTRSDGKFFIVNSQDRLTKNMDKLSEGYRLFSELPVDSFFLSQDSMSYGGYAGYDYSSNSYGDDSSLGQYYFNNNVENDITQMAHAHPRTGSIDSSSSSVEKKRTSTTISSRGLPPPSASSKTMLSADAPVFTPSSVFATCSTTVGEDSYRIRAVSDSSITRDDRAMSCMAFLPPSALSVMHEDLATTTGDSTRVGTAVSSPPGLERMESRPAECKQM